MTRVLFVRHGQASAGASDYDALSSLGRTQSHRLGRWLAERGRRPTHVLVGPRKRHVDTFGELAAGYASTGAEALPAPTTLEALDEHHAVQLLVGLAPTLASREDAMGEAARRAFGGDKRAFVDLVLLTMPAWARGELHHPDVEPWPEFLARARTVAPHLAALGDDATVWVVSSGGLISTVIGEAMGCSLERTFELMFATRNTAMSELSVRRDGEGLSLFSFNVLPHLEDHEITFV